MNQSAFLFYVPGSSKDGQGFLQFGCKALKPLLNLRLVWSQVKGLHQSVRNTLGISSIGPYWNLKSVNYFKREHSFL